MDFAKNFLSKYGWKEGQGIGKNLDGIAKPLKANLKFDNDGLGFDKAKDFTNRWWETAFNDAAKNIKIDTNANNQVSMSLVNGESIEISTTGVSKQKLKNQNSDSGYAGAFIKSRSTLQKKAVSDDEENEIISFSASKNMTDDELLLACGGRTAHKGARHGLKLSGKLNRIEEQERQLLVKYSGKIDRDSAQEVFKDWIEVDTVKKIEKKLKKKKIDSPLQSTETLSPDSEKLATLLNQCDYVVKYKSKKKKKRHRALDEDLANSLNGLQTISPIEEKSETKLNCINENSIPIRKKDKKMKKKKKRKAIEHDDGYLVNDDIEIDEPIDQTDSIKVVEITKKKKNKLKKKIRKLKNTEESFGKSKKRKIKKKVTLSDSDCLSANDSSDTEIKEHRLTKQIKMEMEKHPNKKFKVIAENLTPFQSKQLVKAGLKVVEKKEFNPRLHKKEKKEFNKIANLLENAMNFDEVDSVSVTEEKIKKINKKKKKQK